MSTENRWWTGRRRGWTGLTPAASHLDPDAALVAMEFGYLAREVWPSETTWAGVSRKVEEDWKLSGNETPWAEAEETVRLGWVAAEPTIVSPTHPKAPEEPPEALAERREPGEKVPRTTAAPETSPGERLDAKLEPPVTGEDVKLVPGARPKIG